MHHISFGSGNSSFNYTTPVQEAPNRFASAPANSPPPATTTSIAQASEGLQRPVAMPSMQAQLLRQLEGSPSHPSRQEGVRHSATAISPTFSSAELDTMLAKAVDAQRLDILTQAGPSNSLHRKALEQLQQRRCQPAAGGLEIPFTPNSLLGGGGSKRVDQLGSTSRDIQACPAGAMMELAEAIAEKEQLIDQLAENHAAETNPARRAIAERHLRQESQHLAELRVRLAEFAIRDRSRNRNR